MAETDRIPQNMKTVAKKKGILDWGADSATLRQRTGGIQTY